jgi:hypothetical protein
MENRSVWLSADSTACRRSGFGLFEDTLLIPCGVGAPLGFGQRRENPACLGRKFYVVGVFLNPMGYSDSEEKRILEALGRSARGVSASRALQRPPADILKSIASHEMLRSQAEKRLDRSTSCSPATETFLNFRLAIEASTLAAPRTCHRHTRRISRAEFRSQN